MIAGERNATTRATHNRRRAHNRWGAVVFRARIGHARRPARHTTRGGAAGRNGCERPECWRPECWRPECEQSGSWVCAALALCGLVATAAAEGYPDRSIRMVVAFPAGGTLDVLARIVSQKLTEQWGQSVVVENRAGAGGNIGVTAVATATPDGTTLHFGAQSIAVNATLAPIKGFDPTRDLAPVVLVGTAQDVLMVPPDSPAHSVGELVALAKAKPGTLDYASLGSGSSGHLATVLFSDLTGIKLQHVPYSGINQAYTDIFTGRLSLWISTLGSHLANIQAGKVRALAVSGTGAQLPDVPTFKELGVPFVDETSWYAIFAPRDTHPNNPTLTYITTPIPTHGRHHRQDQCRREPHPPASRREGEEPHVRLSLHRRAAATPRRSPARRDQALGRCGEERVARPLARNRFLGATRKSTCLSLKLG